MNQEGLRIDCLLVNTPKPIGLGKPNRVPFATIEESVNLQLRKVPSAHGTFGLHELTRGEKAFNQHALKCGFNVDHGLR